MGLLVQADFLVGIVIDVDVGVGKGDGNGDGISAEIDAVGATDGRSTTTVSLTIICGVAIGLATAVHPAKPTNKIAIANQIAFEISLFDIFSPSILGTILDVT
jgi:hypothetical protein